MASGTGTAGTSGGAAPYARPASVEAALALLESGRWTVLAGGTDVYAAHVGHPVPGPILDITAIDALRGLREAPGPDGDPGVAIGALARWRDVLDALLPAGMEALAQVAREVGGAQVQNRATVAGNVCNASPAADGVPALMALDAQAVLRSRRGVRRVPVTEFVLGNRRTARASDELLVELWLPRRSAAASSRFVKLGHRRYLVIGIAMVAVALDVDTHDRVCSCGIAVGACGPAARRLRALEAALLTTPRARLAERAREALDDAAVLAPLSPIDDVRGTAAYRRDAVREMLGRVLAEAAAGTASLASERGGR